MRKRRKLMDSAAKSAQKRRQLADEEVEVDVEGVVSSARGRLQGALLDAIEPHDDSDEGSEQGRRKRHKQQNGDFCYETNYIDSDEEDGPQITRTAQKQSYVLKLFDRSVDLWQFEESTPLYPMCRAWMLNKPKANYNELTETTKEEPDGIELPGPEGDPMSRVPPLLPVQEARNKDNININYGSEEANLPSRDQLLQSHLLRWNAIREAWQEQNHLFEKRYSATQDMLNKINNSELV